MILAASAYLLNTAFPAKKMYHFVKYSIKGKSVDDLLEICSFLSAYLRGRFANLAIVQRELSEACNYVVYRVDDVLADKSITYRSAEEMRPASPYKLAVQQGTDIDLTTSGSMLIAGKTRGAKPPVLLPLCCRSFRKDGMNTGAKLL